MPHHFLRYGRAGMAENDHYIIKLKTQFLFITIPIYINKKYILYI